ncbi:hypothetical protein ADUPG1_011504, partial [Aduncisulcus paluster]
MKPLFSPDPKWGFPKESNFFSIIPELASLTKNSESLECEQFNPPFASSKYISLCDLERIDMKLKASTSIKGALIYVSFDSSPKDGDIESSPVIYFQASCDDGTTISSRKIKLSMEPGWYFLPIYPTPSETEDSASEIHPTKVEPTLDTGKKDIPFD